MSIDIVEVKTKAAAEKALKEGKPIRIVGGAFALAVTGLTGINIEIKAPAKIELSLTDVRGIVSQDDWESSRVVAWGSSRVEAWGSSRVVAWGSSSVVARGSSSVVARESSRVEARESSSVVARESSSVVAWESSSVVAWESSSVVAWGSSRVVAWGSSSVEARGSSRVVAWGSSRVVALGSSRVVARGSSRVEARGSSRVEARGSSRVEARESSSVVAWESSSVVATGYSMIQVRGTGANVTASGAVCVNLWSGASAEGGRQQVVTLSTSEDWCGYYGVPIRDDGTIILFKGVDQNFRSGRGGDYTPGNVPEADRWDGGKRECSHGLHWSPTPRHSHEFCKPQRYIAAPHRVEDIVVHWDGDYPQKAMTRSVAGPVFEVDIDGDPIPVTEVAK